MEVRGTPELGAPAGVSRALGEAQGTFSSLGENQGLTPRPGLWELQAAVMFARWLLFNTRVRLQASLCLPTEQQALDRAARGSNPSPGTLDTFGPRPPSLSCGA